LASSLTIENVHAAYGAVRVIEDVSISVGAGETVALLGTNGNGKSTLMKCVMGIVRPTSGRIIAEIDGVQHSLVGMRTEQIVDLGIALVPEGRRLFPKLTVEENLLLGAFRPKARAQIKTNLEFCHKAFPRLAERRRQLAGSMSGGEQQMLALARILRIGARLLLLDEITEGLAPVIVQALGRVVRELKERGFTMILVEQNFRFAAPLADRHYVVEHGRIVDMVTKTELSSSMDKLHRYLGV
jgi:branched-chain amino acid transport system ATP-binding protein